MKNLLAKGTLFLMISQLFVILSGYIIHISLARLLGAEAYGNLGVILSIVVISKTIFLTGINRAISKYISEENSDQESIVKAGRDLQIIIIFISIILFIIFSGRIANFLKDSSLKYLILYSSLVLFTAGLYVIYSKGLLLGLRRFKDQSIIEFSNSAFKVSIALILVILGFGLYGAITAYIFAPLLATILAFKISKSKLFPKITEKFSKIKLIKFAIPITIFYASITTTMDLGLLLIKSITVSGPATGFYTAANTISKICVGIFTALPSTMLPSISNANAKKNQRLVFKYVKQSFRYSFIILSPLVILVFSYSKNIITLLYSNEFSPASGTLKILIIGFGFFAIFMLFSTIMWSIGNQILSSLISIIVLTLSFILNKKLIPIYGIEGGAVATTIVSFLGLILTGLWTYYKIGKFIEIKSLIKITSASMFILILSNWLQTESNIFILFVLIIGIIYFLTLNLIKEINVEDLNIVKNIIKNPLKTK